MRVVSFLVYLSFLLLGGKGYASVSQNQNEKYLHSLQKITHNDNIKLSDESQTITLIENISVDFEEEFHTDNDSKECSRTVFFTGKYSLINTLYAAHFHLSVLNYYNKNHEIVPHLQGNSCPIYLAQRVLRI